MGPAMLPNCYYKLMGDVVGPVTTDDVRSLAGRGIIERDTPLRVGDQGEWIPASRVKNLFTGALPGASGPALPAKSYARVASPA